MVDGAKLLFERSAFVGNYAGLPKISSVETKSYWESDIMGNPRLQGGVKFLIANFATLFGTDMGRKTQQLADHYSWPLFWALGNAGNSRASDEPGNERLLDPTNATAYTNATLPSGAMTNFETVWAEVAQARATNSPSEAQIGQWWTELTNKQVRVAPLTAFACSAKDTCVATELNSGDCICKLAADAGVAIV